MAGYGATRLIGLGGQAARGFGFEGGTGREVTKRQLGFEQITLPGLFLG